MASLTKTTLMLVTLGTGLSACGKKKGGAGATDACQALETVAPVVVQPTDGSSGGGGTIGGLILPGARTPPTPTISSPPVSPYVTATDEITIQGSCETGATVILGGDASGQTPCSASTYQIKVAKTADGTYTISVSQKDSGGNASGSVSTQWTRNTQRPAAPGITVPVYNPRYTRAGTLTISGSCETGNAVALAGEVMVADVSDPAGSLGQTCANGTYSYTVNKGADGTYNFTLTQTSAINGLTSNETTLRWVRDNVPPSDPTITTPATSSYLSRGALTISGACETGASVVLGGNVMASEMLTPLHSLVATCASSVYTFVVAKPTDGVFNLMVSQLDQAGNAAANSVALQWTLDQTAPAAPPVSSPTVNPYYSTGNSVTIAGGCEAGATVTLTGVPAADVTSPAGSLTQACAASAFSYTVQKTADGTYAFSVYQTDVAGNSSLSSAVNWVRDTQPPANPTITSPAASPAYYNGNLVLSGGCETGARVTLGGDVVAGHVTAPPGSLTQTCSSSTYSFTIAKASDGTFNLTVAQTDPAGNPSAGNATKQWIKDTTAPAAPTISTPASSPTYSNGASIVVSGACEVNATVALSGDLSASDVTSPAGSLTQTCGAGSYSFTVGKSAQGTFTINVSQTDRAGNPSASDSTQWVRDTAAPSAPSIITRTQR